MTSFVKKTFLLAISLTCFIYVCVGYTLVPGITVPPGYPIPQRVELRTFINDNTSLNIYLIALESMQQTDINELLSYYLISGIHGSNLAWDNDTGGNFFMGSGYCYHAHPLFPTWHRPYMSLYEKTILDVATQIVQGFTPGTQKNNHLAALATWRMPYWDWAMDPSLPTVLRKKNIAVTRMANGVLKKVIIPNPLYSYRLQIPNDFYVAIYDPPPLTIETVRNPTVKNDVFVSRQNYTSNQMIFVGPQLKSGVFDALTAVTDYNAFSNIADGFSSIEGVHGLVHTISGGFNPLNGLAGQMTFPLYASFDPLFYLHHTNVDRLFAIWQALNPDSYLTDNTTVVPNQDTELHPFRKADNQYWTSRLARNITTFGYTYPELADCVQQTVIEAVNTLYGPPPPPPPPPPPGRKRKRALTSITSATSTASTTVSVLTRTTARSLNTTTSKLLTTTTAKSSTKTPTTTTQRIFSATYNEYKAQIQMSSAAVKGSFLVCVFLGKPSSDDSNYTADPNFVGLVGVFAPQDVPQSQKKMIQGTVPLTTAFNKLAATKQLQDMTANSIESYLSQNLQLRIVGDQSNGFDTTGLQVNVITTALNLPISKYVMPVWGKLSSVYQATQVNLASKISFLPASTTIPPVEDILTDSMDEADGPIDYATLLPIGTDAPIALEQFSTASKAI